MNSENIITLSRSMDVPFERLVLSRRNVRRIQTGQSIEDLSEDIARRTLLQSLSSLPFVSPATKLSAFVQKAIFEPSGENTGVKLSLFPCPPVEFVETN